MCPFFFFLSYMECNLIIIITQASLSLHLFFSLPHHVILPLYLPPLISCLPFILFSFSLPPTWAFVTLWRLMRACLRDRKKNIHQQRVATSLHLKCACDCARKQLILSEASDICVWVCECVAVRLGINTPPWTCFHLPWLTGGSVLNALCFFLVVDIQTV